MKDRQCEPLSCNEGAVPGDDATEGGFSRERLGCACKKDVIKQYPSFSSFLGTFRQSSAIEERLLSFLGMSSSIKWSRVSSRA